jgi:hypothetical protein
MAKISFQLVGTTQDLADQQRFEDTLLLSNDLRNFVYRPVVLNNLNPRYTHLKIKDKIFTNCSFSKTTIMNIFFENCNFVDCLFLGVKIIDCEFHNCRFINVNTHKITIEKTYIDPNSFSDCFKWYHYSSSNIAVHLYQQLLKNSQDRDQQRFCRDAEYNFKKWSERLNFNMFWRAKPHKINFKEYMRNVVFSWIYRLVFGYGLRFPNFFLTFLVTFITFFSINYKYWENYALAKKDVAIESFNTDSATVASSFFYTLDVTTKLIDSQIQPRSSLGMFSLSIQSILAFVLLSALITLLLNRFVK